MGFLNKSHLIALSRHRQGIRYALETSDNIMTQKMKQIRWKHINFIFNFIFLKNKHIYVQVNDKIKIEISNNVQRSVLNVTFTQ